MTSNSRSEIARHASPRSDVVGALVILAAVVVMAGPGITRGGLGWSDAPNHAFDGAFILDFFKAWPIGHVRAWADQFYLRNPALGIIVYYPPGFAAVEACFFAVFGVNVFAARLTVLLFAVGAGWLMYALGKRWFDRPTGLFAALLLITCPHGFLWMNDVMLEWPATFWILAAVYCFEMDRQTRSARWPVAFGASMVMAFMTKQTAGFILPVLLAHSLISTPTGPPLLRRGDERTLNRYWRRPAFLVSLFIAIAIIGGYIIATRSYTALPAHLLRPSLNLAQTVHWPGEILGWPLLPVALLGILSFLFRSNRGPRGLLLMWLLGWTGFSLLITAKEPRYFFFALPPTMFAAARFLLGHVKGREAALSWATDRARLVFLGVLVAAQAISARSGDVGRLPRYDGAVAELAKRSDADLVLVDAVRDGQFVFDLYQSEQARRRLIPLRASKVLYARSARERYDYQQFVESAQDIVKLLDRYGVRYIVIESKLPATEYVEADPAPRKLLRELLARDKRFELVKSWPLACGDPIWRDVELRLYAYPSCPPRTSKTITLSFPAMGRDVTVQLP